MHAAFDSRATTFKIHKRPTSKGRVTRSFHKRSRNPKHKVTNHSNLTGIRTPLSRLPRQGHWAIHSITGGSNQNNEIGARFTAAAFLTSHSETQPVPDINSTPLLPFITP